MTAVTAMKWGDAYKCFISTKAKRCNKPEFSQYQDDEISRTYHRKYRELYYTIEKKSKQT